MWHPSTMVLSPVSPPSPLEHPGFRRLPSSAFLHCVRGSRLWNTRFPTVTALLLQGSYGRGSVGLSSASSPVPPVSYCPGPSPSFPGSSMKNACWRNAYRHWMEGTRVFYQNGGLKFCLCLTINGSYQKMKIWYRHQSILQAVSLWGAENKVIHRSAAFPSLWVLSRPRNSLHN